MIITIDGQVATGKSTIAKHLARELGFIYFDTGAMYRCLAYELLQTGVDYHNPKELDKFLEDFRFEIKMNRGSRQYFVSKTDVTDLIRTPDITQKTSEISAIPAIRQHLVAIQRNFAVGVDTVFEGRDMGTVVFPEAELKVFLTGSDRVRAKRRFNELKDQYPNITLEEVMKQIHERDKRDLTRDISPLKQPEGALVIDTTNLTVDEIVQRIVKEIMEVRS